LKIMPMDSTLERPRSYSQRCTDHGRLKRVLYVMELNPVGQFPSLSEQALVLAREFRERGSLFLPVYLGPLDRDLGNRHAEDGVPVEELDMRTFRWAGVRRLLRLVRANRIEVVHWNFYHPLVNGYLWALSVVAPRVEHFYTDHISRPAGNSDQGKAANLKWVLKWPLSWRYRQTFCISEYVQSELRKQHWPNLRVVYNFINTDRFHPDADRRREVRGSMGVGEEFIALTVAYLIKDKGVDVAVRAMAQLPEDVVLWVVGDGPERGNLQTLAQDLNLGRRVRFLGSHRNIVPFMQAADCFVCPSVWKEGAGNANFEAMACGLPDIASRVGGIPEFVEDGRNGFLFAPGDHRELADRIRRLADDPELRDRMGRDARSNVIDRYSTQSLLAEHLDIHRAAPGRGRGLDVRPGPDLWEPAPAGSQAEPVGSVQPAECGGLAPLDGCQTRSSI
jgi:glycosyltransferase involved in cell wall biosynthesis